jgi:hypothetical protein
VSSRYATPVVGVAAFLIRFLRVGAIENDHYVYLARAYQVLHGDWPVRDFVDPGLPLGYVLSAGAAAIAGPTLLTEAVLSVALFAIAVGVTFALARRASGSALVGLAAAAVLLLFPPRLYNSSKILVPVIAMLIAWHYADRPASGRAAALGAWIGVAFLFRHDYALYVGAATAVMLVLAHRGDPGALARRALTCMGAASLLIVPWLLYVQAEQGIAAYFAAALRFSADEGRRTTSHWPAIFYAFAALPLASLLLVRRGTRTLGPAHVAFAGTLVLVSELILLRDQPAARLPDVYASTLVIAAIILGRVADNAVWRLLNAGSSIAIVVTAVALLVMKPAALANVPHLITRGPLVVSRLRNADPAITPTPGRAPLVRYLARCTTADDRLLVGGFAPELPVLAHRAFAGGLPDWIRGYYDAPADVARARAQLAHEHVGAAIMLDGGDAFTASWPALAADLRSRGLTSRFLQLPNESVELWLPPMRGKDRETGLPCR